MDIFRYGISLLGLKEGHLEMVRKHRNSSGVAQFMEYRTHISPEMQMNWFKTLNPHSDFYFVTQFQGEMIGLMQISNVEMKKKSCHSGMFIWNKLFLDTHVPALASFALLDVFLLLLDLELVYAKVKKGNDVAVKYNASLGFKIKEGEDDKSFGLYKLKKCDYRTVTERNRSNAIRVSGAESSISVNQYEYNLLMNMSNGLLLKNALAIGIRLNIAE